MATDWEEVKKLASDFQRTQQMSSVQKLSERNCIDIIKRLIEMKLIDVIFTNDGKEYLTSDHLLYEIKNELYATGGRIAIPDLVTTLNVDYGHIETKANYISRTSGGEINIVLGQLVSREYKDNLASEIDLHLQESGSLAISELAKQYDLPADFVINLIDERLDSLIKGKLDKEARIIYTYDYIASYESKISGIFSAITRPVALQTIVNRYDIPEKILNNTLEEFLRKKRILGSISGSTYIPEIYSKIQQEYVNNFYKHNRYLDYSTLIKLGITNPQSFLQKKFGDQLCYLETCAVDQMLSIQIETSIEDCIQSNSFVDLVDIMPSALSVTDIDTLIKKTLEHNKNLQESTIILCETVAVSNTFISKAMELFNDIKREKAMEALKNGVLLNYFAKSRNQSKSDQIEDRKTKEVEVGSSGKKGKKGGGGGSGNSQGREIKTKATKKKYKPGKQTGKADQDVEESVSSLSFLSEEEIAELLAAKLNSDKDAEEMSEDLVQSIAQHIIEELQKTYETFAKELFVSHTAEANKNKRSFADVQKCVGELYAQVYLYNKGIQVLDSEDLKSKLLKHLQKTLCSEAVNMMVSFFSEENLNDNATSDMRNKLINRLDAEYKNEFIQLNNSLIAVSIEEFLDELDQCASKVDMMIKKVDSKREKAALSDHKQSLIFQLAECQDPILCLHIAVLLAFLITQNCMLHATGKFVPQILIFLHKHLDETLYKVLKDCQELVLRFVSSKEEPIKNELQQLLNQSMGEMKNLMNNLTAPKKS